MVGTGELLLVVAACLLNDAIHASVDRSLGKFTNEWAVHIPGGAIVARQVASDFGYEYHGQVGEP